MGDAASTVVSYVPVRVRENSVVKWVIVAPFKFGYGMLNTFATRMSYKIWGEPVYTNDKMIEVTRKGWFGSYYKELMPAEVAIHGKYITVEDAITLKQLTEDEATILGLRWVTYKMKGWTGEYDKTRMLKRAVEGGDITVDDAIRLGFITADQAAKAPWLKPAETRK